VSGTQQQRQRRRVSLLALLAEAFHAQVGRVDHEFGGAGKVVDQMFEDGSGEVVDGSAAAADQVGVLGPARQVVTGSGSDQVCVSDQMVLGQ